MGLRIEIYADYRGDPLPLLLGTRGGVLLCTLLPTSVVSLEPSHIWSQANWRVMSPPISTMRSCLLVTMISILWVQSATTADKEFVIHSRVDEGPDDFQSHPRPLVQLPVKMHNVTSGTTETYLFRYFLGEDLLGVFEEFCVANDIAAGAASEHRLLILREVLEILKEEYEATVSINYYNSLLRKSLLFRVQPGISYSAALYKLCAENEFTSSLCAETSLTFLKSSWPFVEKYIRAHHWGIICPQLFDGLRMKRI